MPSLLSRPAYAPRSYEEAIQQLPIPTWDQSERFARHLSEAHSWYKFLPDREYEFFLFLDPFFESSEEYVKNSSAVEQNSPIRSNYPLTATKSDFQRFGFWNYHRSCGSSRFPVVRITHSRKVPVPREWAKRGRVLLDPFMHTVTPFAYLQYDRFSTKRWPSESFYERIGMCLEERAARRPRRLKAVFEASIPSDLRTALEPRVDNPRSSEMFWPDNEWLQKLYDLQAPQKLWSPLCKYFALLKHERRVHDLLESVKNWPKYSTDFYATALAEERVLQLTRLTDTMDRFLRRAAPRGPGFLKSDLWGAR